jgi:hypothetical protein
MTVHGARCALQALQAAEMQVKSLACLLMANTALDLYQCIAMQYLQT